MNQSYRVVWQASTNTCCAVSELARSKGKSRSRAVQCRAKSLARIITVSLGLMGADAALAGTESTEAASPIGQVQSNDPAGGKNKGIKDALAEDETAVAAAVRRRASKINPLTFNTIFPNNPIAFRVDARARTLDGAASGNAARIANDAEDAPAPHPDAKAPGALSDTGQAGSISAGKAGSERQITNLAAGTADTDAVNLGQVKNLVGDGSILRYVKTNGKNDGSDDAVALDEDAMAIGASAKATNTGSTAVGGKAQANGVDSSAFGVDAQANGNGGSLAAGAYSTAQGHFSAALGSGSFTLGDFSTALGAYASALSDGTTALGAYSIASGDQAIAVGSKSEAIGTASIAMGNFAKTENNGAIAIGSQYQEASGEAGFKEAAYAGGRNAVALGAGAFAYATDSLALGPRATVEADNSVALGDHALADRANTVSVGNTRVSDGTAVQTRQIVNVAAGTEENDAVNVGQMNDAIGVVNGSLAGAMMYDDAGKQKMTLAGSSGSVIDNLADGAIAAGSKQAVNGSQLHQVGDSVAQMLGGGAMMGVNGFTGPVFGVQGGSYHNVGDALGALDGALDSLGNRVSSLENGGAPVAEGAPKPVAKMVRDVVPPATPPSDPGAATDSGKDIVTQDQLDDVKDYADAGNKQTLGSANQYTDKKLADKVSQSDFNEFKGNVDQRFDKVNKKISRVGAMASAMAGMAGAIAAAPANENRVSAALGGYAGQTALSLGYAKRISSSGALLVGGSIASGGESSGTVGVSFGW